MAQIEKALFRETSHLRSIPLDILAQNTPLPQDEPSHTCFRTLEKSFFRIGQITFRNDLKAIPLEPKNHRLTPLALGILFPGTSITNLLNIHNMPTHTLEEKIAKENAYRNLILTNYALKDVVADKNGALRAIIASLNPDIDPNSEEITSLILRGDIIQHVIKNPENYQLQFQGSDTAFNEWCNQIANSEASIGTFELRVMSDLLETPIHVYSYDNAKISSKGTIEPGREGKLGEQFNNSPLNLYYDPVRHNFHPMEERE